MPNYAYLNTGEAIAPYLFIEYLYGSQAFCSMDVDTALLKNVMHGESCDNITCAQCPVHSGSFCPPPLRRDKIIKYLEKDHSLEVWNA